MGVIPAPAKALEKAGPSSGPRRSMQTDIAKLKPLNPNALKGFSQFRDPSERDGSGAKAGDKSSKKRLNDDSDDEGDKPRIKLEDSESNLLMSPEDARRGGELADAVQKIRVCLSTSVYCGCPRSDVLPAQATTFK